MSALSSCPCVGVIVDVGVDVAVAECVFRDGDGVGVGQDEDDEYAGVDDGGGVGGVGTDVAEVDATGVYDVGTAGVTPAWPKQV